jgi:hypothetical protein
LSNLLAVGISAKPLLSEWGNIGAHPSYGNQPAKMKNDEKTIPAAELPKNQTTSICI